MGAAKFLIFSVSTLGHIFQIAQQSRVTLVAFPNLLLINVKLRLVLRRKEGGGGEKRLEDEHDGDTCRVPLTLLCF